MTTLLAAFFVSVAFAPSVVQASSTEPQPEVTTEDPATRAARLFSEDRFAEAFGDAYDAYGFDSLQWGRVDVDAEGACQKGGGIA
jgi:hypothetical protein